MATITDKLMILDDTGFPRTVKDSGHADPDSIALSVDLTAANLFSNGELTVTGETSFNADVTVQGDLQVSGDIVSAGQKDVVTEDAFIDLRINSQNTGSAGLTAQIDNSRVQTMGGSLKALRAAFNAGSSGAGNGAQLVVDGDMTNATGYSSTAPAVSTFSVSKLTFDLNPQAGDIVRVDDGQRLNEFTFVAGAPADFTEVQVGADANASMANFKTQYDLRRVAADNESFTTCTVAANEATLAHTVKSQPLTVTFTSAAPNTFSAVKDSESFANGEKATQEIIVHDNAVLAGTGARIVIRDSAGANSITLSEGVEWNVGANANATAENIWNAALLLMQATPALQHVQLRYTSGGNVILIDAIQGGNSQNTADIAFSNNAANGLREKGNTAVGNGTFVFSGGTDFCLELDIVAIGGLLDHGENNGLFCVDDPWVYDGGTGRSTLKILWVVPSQVGFCQNQFETVAAMDPAGNEDGKFMTQLGLSVLASSDGTLEDASGASIGKGKFVEAFANWASADSTPQQARNYIAYESFGNVSLQEAYSVGNTITTDGKGDLEITVGDIAARAFKVLTGTNNQGDVTFGNAGAGQNLRHFTGNFASDVNISGGTQTLSADNGQFSISGQSALANSIVVAEGGGGAGEAVLIVGLGAGASSGGLSLDDGTGTISMDGGVLEDSAMDRYIFEPATSFSIESAAVSIGTDSAAASTFSVGTNAGLNTIAMDAGTGAFDILSDAASSIDVSAASLSIAGVGLTLEGGTGSFILQADDHSNIAINGPAATASDKYLGIYADHATAGQMGIVSLGQKADGSAGTDVMGIAADVNILGRVATPAAMTDLYTDAYRKPMGMYFGSKGAFAVGSLVCLQSNVAAGNKIQEAESDAAQDNDRMFIGIAMEAAGGAGEAIATATIAGSIAFCRMDAGPLQADVGKPVYVSGTAGVGTLTAPSASGHTVFKIGMLVAESADGNGNYPVLIQPQFISKRP